MGNGAPFLQIAYVTKHACRQGDTYPILLALPLKRLYDRAPRYNSSALARLRAYESTICDGATHGHLQAE
jgi:hypothetical protein